MVAFPDASYCMACMATAPAASVAAFTVHGWLLVTSELGSRLLCGRWQQCSPSCLRSTSIRAHILHRPLSQAGGIVRNTQCLSVFPPAAVDPYTYAPTVLSFSLSFRWLALYV